MAPLRGSRGGRGRGRGRGSSRGSHRGGSHGGGRGNVRGSGKIARSGIRTRAGYRKFDSQRLKNVESEESEDGEPDLEQPPDQSDISDEEEAETVPRVNAYNALLQSFRQPDEESGRKRKRRKVEVVEEIVADESQQAGPGVEVDDESDDEVEEAVSNGEVHGSEDEDGDDEDDQDPFEVHFANSDDNQLSRRLKAIQNNQWRTEKQDVPKVGAFTILAPPSIEDAIPRKPTTRSIEDVRFKNRLLSSAQKRMSLFDPFQQAISPYLFNYNDLLVTNRTSQNARNLRMVACLHSLNHILKGRDKVLKNSARLSHSEGQDLDVRDQGFTRPKVLILSETRQMCAKYADCIVQLLEPEQQENKQRFLSSFSAPRDDRETMPEDYRELFEGNNDNNFVTSMKFTRKTLKFYSPFYTSDIILASPLGLRRIIENEDPKKRDHDFLSSIEIVIADQADAMYMQNWANVESVFRHLNLMPQETHGSDFNRVRSWYLDGHAKYLRQTIVFSAYLTPDMNRLFNTSMLNIAGKTKLMSHYSEGAIASIGNGVKQTFSRLESSSTSPANDPDARFKYFTSSILPTLLRLPKPADGAKGILIFIPSYYDFLRLRNFFATSTLTQNTSFAAIHEYTEVSEQRRARSHFLSGRHSILMYTQRAHHFYRLRIKGVKRVVCYGVPENPVFYEELVSGFLRTSLEEGRVGVEEAAVRVLFSRWDGLALERVAGSARVKGMLGGKGDTFEFV